jgi:hypothetical protein
MGVDVRNGNGLALGIIGAVLGLCVLSGVGFSLGAKSSFEAFVARSKTSEATWRLQALFRGAAAYYAQEQVWPGGRATACTVEPARTSEHELGARSNWAQELERDPAVRIRDEME